MEIKTQKALTSFTVSDAYRRFDGQAYSYWSQKESRSCIEYLIPKNNIIVLDSYFNLMNKSYFIHKFWKDLG